MLAGCIKTSVFIYHITRRHISRDILFNSLWPVSLAALPTAWVCDLSFAGIAGSNPNVGMEVSVVYCKVESLRRADR